jgi:hypothetical protein
VALPLVAVAFADNKTVVELKLRMVVLAGIPAPVMICPAIKPVVCDAPEGVERTVIDELPLVVAPWKVNQLVVEAAADIVTVLSGLIFTMVVLVGKDPAVAELYPVSHEDEEFAVKVTACPGMNPSTDDSAVMVALPLLITPKVALVLTVDAFDVVTLAANERVMVLGVVAEVDGVIPVMTEFA